MQARFTLGLRGFLRETITLEQARATLCSAVVMVLNRILHRSSRTDPSPFPLDLSLLDIQVSRGLRIPVGFLASLNIQAKSLR
jgi:hypothetical protein